MKKMKKSEKVFRTLLIAAMGVVLSGVSLATAFASYDTYNDFTIKVEHKFDDKNNGTAQDPDLYNPRDDLIGNIDANGGHGLNVIITDKDGNQATAKDENGSKTDISDTALNGTETGVIAAEKDILDLIEKGLIDKLTGEEGQDLLDKYKEDLQAEDRPVNPDEKYNEENPIPIRPDYGGIATPVLNEEQLAQKDTDLKDRQEQLDAEKASNPEPAMDDFENYEDYLAAHEKWNEWSIEHQKAQDALADDFKQYESLKSDFVKWSAWREEHKDEIAAWEQYDKEKKEYTQWLESITADLRNWFKDQEAAYAASDMYDENMKESYEKAYADTLNKVLDAITDGSLDELKEELSDKDVDGNMWVSEEATYYGKADIDSYLAELDQMDQSMLNNVTYDGGQYTTTSKITVVRVEYEKDADGNLIQYNGAYKIAKTVTYVSTNNGQQWQAVNENNEPVGDLLDSKTIMANAGRVQAFTFTFEHKWAPSSPSSEPGGDPIAPETPAPSQSVPPTPTPIPSTSVPPSETPIDEPEVPLDEPEVPLDEPEVPLDEIELPLEEIPLTGDISYLWYAAALISAAGLLFLVYRNKETA